MRAVLVTLLSLTAACGARLSGIGADLSVEPGALVFSDTAAGDSRSLPLRLMNPTRAPLQLRLSAPAPFALELELRLEGGEARNVDVTFAPPEAGATYAAALLVTGDASASVELSGTGVEPASCASDSACRPVHRDPLTNTCVTGTAPDGTACGSDNACLQGGRCTGGACVGSPVSCDDHDACTVDACEPAGGCVHFAVTCAEPEDPCQVARCDPALGCATSPAADGTACGESDCATARVCLGGTCQSLAVPDGHACGGESPCRARGRCQAQSCVQPPATALAVAWSYPMPYAPFDFRGVTDAAGNLYWVQCAQVVNPAACVLVSYSADGLERFRVNVPTLSTTAGAWHLESAGRVVVAGRDAALWAFSTTTGALVWSRPAPGGATLLALAADAQGHVRTTEHHEGKTDTWALSRFDAASGAATSRQLFGPPHGLVLDAQGNSYLVVSDAQWPLGPPGTPVPHDLPGAAAEIHLLSLTPGGGLRFQVPYSQVDAPVAVFNGELLLESGRVLSALDGAARPSAARNPTLYVPAPLMSAAARYRFDEWGCCPLCSCAGPTGTTLEGWSVGAHAARFSWGAFASLSPHVTELELLADGSALFASEEPVSRDVSLRALDASGAERFACVLGSALVGGAPLRRWRGPTALAAGRWAVLEHTSCPSCIHDPPPVLRVYSTPSLQPAVKGWTGRSGSPGRSGAPR